MSKKSIVLDGLTYKALATKVTKFPGLGSFGGSDLVHLECSDGYLHVASSGIVQAVARRKCDGELPLCAIDERLLLSFAQTVADSGVVKIWIAGNELFLKSGRNKIAAALIAGVHYDKPNLTGVPELKVSAEAAERIRYLSVLAYNDVTRPELCCVMLSKSGMAYAMDQKAVAVFKTGLLTEANVPLPLSIAKVIEAGNGLYVNSAMTVLRAGWVTYSVPSMVQIAKEYPFGKAKALRAASGNSIGQVAGAKFAGVVDDCMTCLGALAKTEAIADIELLEDRVWLRGSNGGAKFETSIPGTVQKAAKFKLPLDTLSRIRPFLTHTVTFAAGTRGDLYFHMDAGWCMFPGEV